MSKRIGYVAAAAALIVLLVVVLRRTPSPHAKPAATNVPVPTVAAVTNEAPTPAATPTNRVDVPEVFMMEVNKFIVAAQPYGLDGPIKVEDVIAVNDDKRRFMLETKTHLAEFMTKGRTVPQLHHFIATQHASNPVASPEDKRDAMKQWYLATAPWTEQEAIAETHKILERLGIRSTWETQEAKPATIVVKNPQGESVPVTPFYNVTLRGPKGTIMAEFRMGQSGPGRITEWYAVLSADAQ